MRSVELFAGCGGLAFGLAEAGFNHVLVVENDPHASSTLEKNKLGGVRHFDRWPIKAVDVREVKYKRLGAIDLVAGGPPCQPFSIGGKHKGPRDPRNMWPEAIRAVRELEPTAFVFENVRGLLRPAFADYLAHLQLQLAWPDVVNSTRGWRDHLRTLKQHAKGDRTPRYHVIVQSINAADYGAPQKRHRAIIIGVRSDVADQVTAPSPTHSQEALVWSQRIDKTYWERHKISARARPATSESDALIVKRLRELDEAPREIAWTTVRDAIGDLPTPSAPGTADGAFTLHELHPGARVYERHTGSTWDEPAKALKAGDHGVPGGENVLVDKKGQVRYFTLREMVRLQGLPDAFDIDDGWKNPIKQLGNAVPVHVGRVFGNALKRIIQSAHAR
jgi:DNA (cytosine-5)-methyltransferase 1